MCAYLHLLFCLFALTRFGNGIGGPEMKQRFSYAMARVQPQDKVKIQVYYESLCPDSRYFYETDFTPTVRALGNYLDIHVYPYGNAKTNEHGDGTFEISCQHGPPECYGNMLHACSIGHLQNIIDAVYFDSCLMEFSQNNKGSDDEATDKCGNRLGVDPTPIKQCANSQQGFILHKYYGDESHKIGFKAVPYVLINGKEYNEDNEDNFMRHVCRAFEYPPPPCNSLQK